MLQETTGFFGSLLKIPQCEVHYKENTLPWKTDSLPWLTFLCNVLTTQECWPCCRSHGEHRELPWLINKLQVRLLIHQVPYCVLQLATAFQSFRARKVFLSTYYLGILEMSRLNLGSYISRSQNYWELLWFAGRTSALNVEGLKIQSTAPPVKRTRWHERPHVNYESAESVLVNLPV